ncbi:hypothetical protein [Streptomyces sp. NBC_01285]|uniref:hypothetical protein n=1 Tax=Streptomyces sp. NBC_01285 TaxID=2903813 RepID=UPI002250644B|nr:hypothetical protein [Streptomyces sp. NBC_01285]MCX4773765.1 hypothetical protein [Streptomyces sp. NBC_01285]
MNNTPSSDISALSAMASAFDAQRGKLPVPGNYRRLPGIVAVAVARQISELGELITDLGHEVFLRAAAQDHEVHTARVIAGFAAAARPAGEAASALGETAHQLAFLNQTEHLRNRPDAQEAREAAVRVMEDALGSADTALREAAADSLHAASATVSPPSVRLRAARSRSTTTAPAPQPAPPAATPTAAAPGRIVRGR